MLVGQIRVGSGWFGLFKAYLGCFGGRLVPEEGRREDVALDSRDLLSEDLSADGRDRGEVEGHAEVVGLALKNGGRREE